MFDAAVILHLSQCISQALCEFSVVHIFYLFGRDAFTVADGDFFSRREDFLVSWPAFKGTINRNRYNRSPTASAQKSEAGLEGSDFSVAGSCSFREKTDAAALFKFGDDCLDGLQIGLASFYRDGIDGRNQPSEELIFEKCITREEIQMSFQINAAKYRVEITLVVTDQHKSILVGDIFQAIDAQPEEQFAKDSAEQSCNTKPYHLWSSFRHSAV